MTTTMTSADPRDDFISQVVPGQSFAEVGGLWGTINEKVSVAHRNGAASLHMIDITPEGNELWQRFDDRMLELGIRDVGCTSADLLDLAARPDRPSYDVVHCSGILYHISDPIRFVTAIRRLTRRHLVLTSAVTGTRIESDEGVLELPDSTCLFVPALRGREQAIVASYWRRFVGDGAVGITRPESRWRPEDTVPWWWLPTVEALKAMCATAGFRFERGAPHWNDNAYTLLLSAEGSA
jgi:hypothetical protein